MNISGRDMTKPWNEKLKEIRESKNLTQEQLAIKSGLSQGLISGLEKGKKPFTKSNLDKIAGVLECSYRDIFCDKTREDLELELQIMTAKLKIMESKEAGESLKNTKIASL